MNAFARVLFIVFLPVAVACAQVSVELVMDEDRLVAGEPVVVGVRITNLSGQTLFFGQTADWIRFGVESKENLLVPRLGEVDAKGEFSVESAKVVTRRLDLAPAYQLTAPGRYRVTASIFISQWNRQMTSPPKNFEIIAGTRLWEQVFGVPNPDGGTAPPEERKYVLIQAMHLREMRLYLRLTDKSESKIIRVFSLGQMVSFSRPEPQLDKASNLHVLWQSPARYARSFSYVVVNPQGEVIRRETHEYTATRPALKFDKDGNVLVSGGTRRITATDLPASNARSGSDQPETRAP